MNQKFKAVLCLLLALFLAVPLIGCKGDQKDPGQTEPPAAGTVAPNADDPYVNYPNELGIRNYEGKKFTIASVNVDPSSYFVLAAPEDYTGFSVSDAMYGRDQAIYENYGIEIEYVPYETGETLKSALNLSISGGMYVADMINSYLANSILPLFNAGQLYDINSIPLLNTDNPWWASYFAEGATYRDRLYYAAGMASGGGYFGTVYTMMCNLRLEKDVYLEDGSEMDIFELIQEGNWTLEAMDDIITDYTTNLDADPDISVYSDRLAFAHMRTAVTAGCHYVAAGGKFSTSDSDGSILVELESENSQNIIEKLASIFDKIEDNYNEQAYFNENKQVEAFTSGRALFFGNSITYADYLLQMDDDYAIIPCPKYNSSQEEYFSGINIHTSGYLAVPSNIQEPEFVGYTLEMLGYHTYYKVRPMVYDTILCLRLAKDPRQIKVIDEIYANLYVDLNFINDFAGSASVVENCILDADKNFVSDYGIVKPAIPLMIDRFEQDLILSK